MSLFNIFNNFKTNRELKKEEHVQGHVTDAVLKKLSELPPEKLSILQRRQNPVLETEFEPRTTILPLSEQLLHFEKEYEFMNSKNREFPVYSYSNFSLAPHTSADGFMDYAKFALEKFDIDFTQFQKVNSFAFNLNEPFRERYNELIYYGNTDDLNRISNGVRGEEKLFSQLDVWSLSEEFHSLSNAVLEFNGKSFETDALLFTRFGLFSLEVKNIGEGRNFSIIITEDGQWVKKQGSQETALSNITDQVNYHISMTEAMLREYRSTIGKDVPPVNSFVIIANDDVRIVNNSNVSVFRIDSFIAHIRNLESQYDIHDMKDIMDWMNTFSRPEKGYAFEDFFGEFEYRLNACDELQEGANLLYDVLHPIYRDFIDNYGFYKDFSSRGTFLWYGTKNPSF